MICYCNPAQLSRMLGSLGNKRQNPVQESRCSATLASRPNETSCCSFAALERKWPRTHWVPRYGARHLDAPNRPICPRRVTLATVSGIESIHFTQRRRWDVVDDINNGRMATRLKARDNLNLPSGFDNQVLARGPDLVV